MQAVVPTAEQAEQALLFIHFLGAVLFGTGVYLYLLGRQIDYGCAECHHCRARRAEEAARQRAAQEEFERAYGLGPREDDVPPPPPGPQGGPDGQE